MVTSVGYSGLLLNVAFLIRLSKAGYDGIKSHPGSIALTLKSDVRRTKNFYLTING